MPRRDSHGREHLYELKVSRDSTTSELTGQWRLQPTGGVPAARNEHISIFAIDTHVFGGMSGTDKDSVKQYNDMWKFEYAKSDGSGSWVDVTARNSEYGMPKKPTRSQVPSLCPVQVVTSKDLVQTEFLGKF